MKKTLLFLAAFVPVSLFAAAPPVRESGVNAPGTATNITVSNSAWTLAEPTAQLAGRTAIVVNNLSSNGSNMAGVLSASSSTAGTATNVWPMELAPGSPACIGVTNAVYLWLLYTSTVTASATASIQEVSQ